MAFGAGSNGTGRGGRRWSNSGMLTEMNVVPLVDVVLVLLIIFMLTASAMEFGLEIEVPEVKETKPSAEEHPVISIDRNNQVFLGSEPTNINLLGESLQQQFPDDMAVYLRMDKQVNAEQFLQVVDALNRTGYKVSVVTRAADLPGK